ncbi:MAG: sugar isomerase domain-containing protein [Kiritimatiellia bacterium]
MYQDDYLNAVHAVATHLDGEGETLDAAADLMVDAMLSGHALFTADVGHGNQHDWVQRAGGLAALRHFRFSVSITDAPPKRLADRPRPAGSPDVHVNLEHVRHAVRVSQLRPGDVMLVGSVSGRTPAPVELALACRDAGVRVIGFTSFAYTQRAVPQHPSGRRLKDAVDIAIDIGAPYGDAAVTIEGYDSEVLPVSGVGAIMAGWMIFERVMRKMAARGTPATVFQSVNRDGGEAALAATQARCDAQGY